MSPHRSKRQSTKFGFTCPAGGTWYACSSGSSFVGCCTSDPCSTAGCAQGNVRSGGFNPSFHGQFPDASCGLNSDFWTCTSGQTFWGCCKSNPCKQGACPSGDLVPAFIDRPEQKAVYLSAQSSSTTTSTSASSTATSTSITSGTRTPTSTPTQLGADANPTGQSHSNTKIAIIAGGAAGGGAALAIIVGIIIYFIVHSRKSRSTHRSSLERRQSDLASRSNEKPDMVASPLTEAPPVYSSPKAGGSFPQGHYYPQGPHDPKHPTYPDPHAFRHSTEQHHYELPATASSRGMWEPNHAHHSLTPSELPVEGAQRTELESPMTSPRPFGTPKSSGGGAGDQPNWGSSNSPRQPTHALGITNADVDRIEPSRSPPSHQGYHGK